MFMNLYLIKEFRSSILHYKTEEYCGNMMKYDSEDNGEKIHSILSYYPISFQDGKIVRSNRIGYINRDRNAAKNMKKITMNLIYNGARLFNYMHGNKVDKIENIYDSEKLNAYYNYISELCENKINKITDIGDNLM